jgi:hypothetical protein
VFNTLLSLVGLGATLASVVAGYFFSRTFTENKLRYVDAVHKGSFPILAGIGAAVVALPVVAVLPVVGAGTALLFGGSVAMGTAAGAREIRKRIGA